MAVSLPQWEYKVLGAEGVDVRDGDSGFNASLAEAIEKNQVRNIQLILDALGEQHWELVSLSWPHVFRRQKQV